MEQLDRRGLFAALSALAALGAAAAAAEPGKLAANKVIKFSQMEIRKFENGGEQRRVIHGTLATGEEIEVHETMLPVGAMPHPPHKHAQSEIVFMQTGNCEFVDEDGSITPVDPGDVMFTASNRMHGLKNVGTVPATYIVVEIGKSG